MYKDSEIIIIIITCTLLFYQQATLKKIESKNFFAFRRNEEMGAKIYQMQNEMEEMDRKHSLEVQIYQERLSSLGKFINHVDGWLSI